MQLIKKMTNSEAPNSKSSLFLSSLKKGIEEKMKLNKLCQEEEVELGPI